MPAPLSSPRRRSNSSVCGICGVAFASRNADAESRVRAMTAAMGHRGPDEEGFLAGDARAPGLALGMRRLSILDPAGGHQPMSMPGGRFAIVFNGEIVNHLDVRAPLVAAGQSFRTHSDTDDLDTPSFPAMSASVQPSARSWRAWACSTVFPLYPMPSHTRGTYVRTTSMCTETFQGVQKEA